MVASAGFEELWRGVAYPWECDHMGHMNVQHYASKGAEAAQWLMHRIGLPPARAAEVRRVMAPVADYFRFRREVRGGDILAIRGAVLEIGEDRLAYALEMVDAENDEICATSCVSAIHLDLDAGRALPWPAALRQSASRLQRPWEGERGPRQALAGGVDARSDMAADARDGCVPSYRGTVQAWECDRFGRMAPSAVMARFSHGVWQFGQAIGVGPAFYRAGNVTAGLFYDLRYHAWPVAGDVLVLLSGLSEHGRSSHRYLHKLYDAATGRLVATADSIGINIDAATRRPIAWPAEVAAQSAARLLKVPA